MEKIFLSTSIQIELKDLVTFSRSGAFCYEWFHDYLVRVYHTLFPEDYEYVDLISYKIYDSEGLILGVSKKGQCNVLSNSDSMEIHWVNSLDTETFVSIIEKFVEMRGPK